MLKIKYISIFFCIYILHVSSCKKKMSTNNEKHPDSTIFNSFNHRSYSANELFNKISKEDIDSIPNCILKDRKTLFHYFINQFIP